MPLGYLASRAFRGASPPSEIVPPSHAAPTFRMPGPYPGRVIEVRKPGTVLPDRRVDREAVRAMMDRGMCGLTGADHPHEAWRSLFEKDDIVGIKVNPVGFSRNRMQSAVSHPEIVLETVRNLKALGLPAKNIIIFERYAQEFIDSGYADLMRERELDGCRWYASAAHYTDTQTAVDGFDLDRSRYSPDLTRHVAGYDPDVFAHMAFASPAHDPKDDRRFRSHLSLIVSKMVNKIITIPVLKDHRSAGVTLALKNLSHGMNNNVARSHISGIAHGYPHTPGFAVAGPNQCNTFIPAAVAQPQLREKATLHILDGLVGVYEGGPGVWNKTWATWDYQSLFFATDPVALDHVGWQIIDAKRVQEGWPRAGEMGNHVFTPPLTAAMTLSGIGPRTPLEAVAATAATLHRASGRDSEVFDRRQPEHIFLAGSIGLGVFEQSAIAHRRIVLRA